MIYMFRVVCVCESMTIIFVSTIEIIIYLALTCKEDCAIKSN